MLDLNDSHLQVHEKFSQPSAHVEKEAKNTDQTLDLIIEHVLMKPRNSRARLTHDRGLAGRVRTLWVDSQHV